MISPNCTRMNGQKKKVNVRQQLLPRLSALHVGDAAVRFTWRVSQAAPVESRVPQS